MTRTLKLHADAMSNPSLESTGPTVSAERSALNVERSAPRGAVFLSYASQDTDAARRICAALRTAGVEVWFDQSELRGGDAWDQKIRKQIKECSLFMPIISANTQVRPEGYFRLEWKLADRRTDLIGKSKAFLLPVCIDDTRDTDADVPDSFVAVQWTRLPAGEVSIAFCEHVNALLESGTGVPPVSSEPGLDARTTSASATPVLPGKSSQRRLVSILAAAAAVIGGSFAVWQWQSGNREVGQPQPAARRSGPPTYESSAAQPPSNFGATKSAPADKSIAVLPFANLSGDKEQEYFSDGLTDEILNALARERDLRVVPRTSAFSFKGKNVALPDIARALNVARVVEGSVQKAGSRVRIRVTLTTVADHSSEALDSIERDYSDIFALQDEVARKVVEKITGRIAPAAAAPTKNLAAYDAYLRGRAAQTSGGSPVLLAEATRYYEEAVRLDPDYGLAWARLAQVYLSSIWGNIHRGSEIAAKIRAAVAMAVRLDPNLPETRLALAAMHQFVAYDPEAARHELDALERLRPNNPELPRARAGLRFAGGLWDDELMRLAALAVEIDPENALTVSDAGFMLSWSGRFAEAEPLLDRAWRDRAFPAPVRFKAIMTVRWTGDVTKALAVLETCPAAIRNEYFYHTLAQITALRGEVARTIAANEKLLSVARRDRATFGERWREVDALVRMAWHRDRSGDGSQAHALRAEALPLAQALRREFPEEWRPASHAAVIHAHEGEKDAALAAAVESMRLAERTRDAESITYARESMAEVLAALGHVDAAVGELRVLHDMGYAFGHWLRLWPELEPLRGDAKFQQLMRDAEARANAVVHAKP